MGLNLIRKILLQVSVYCTSKSHMHLAYIYKCFKAGRMTEQKHQKKVVCFDLQYHSHLGSKVLPIEEILLRLFNDSYSN